MSQTAAAAVQTDCPFANGDHIRLRCANQLKTEQHLSDPQIANVRDVVTSRGFTINDEPAYFNGRWHVACPGDLNWHRPGVPQNMLPCAWLIKVGDKCGDTCDNGNDA
jgi:hypothetical protein